MPRVTEDKPKGKKINSDDPWDRIMSVDDYVKDQGMKIAMYGRSGSGKSTAVLSFPRPILYIVPFSRSEVKAFKGEKDVKVVGIDNCDDLLRLVKRQEKEKTFKTVALDHATEFQGLVIKKVGEFEELPEQLSWALLSGDQWQEVNGLTKENFDKLLDLTCNVCLLAQERGENMESDSEIITPEVSYGLTKGVASWLGPRVDNTIHFYVRMGKVNKTVKVKGKDVVTTERKPQYCIRTGPHPVYNTKLRVPKGTTVPDHIVINTNDSVYDKLKQLGVS